MKVKECVDFQFKTSLRSSREDLRRLNSRFGCITMRRSVFIQLRDKWKQFSSIASTTGFRLDREYELRTAIKSTRSHSVSQSDLDLRDLRVEFEDGRKLIAFVCFAELTSIEEKNRNIMK